jgi:hypothetical protein
VAMTRIPALRSATIAQMTPDRDGPIVQATGRRMTEVRDSYRLGAAFGRLSSARHLFSRSLHSHSTNSSEVPSSGLTQNWCL